MANTMLLGGVLQNLRFFRSYVFQLFWFAMFQTELYQISYKLVDEVSIWIVPKYNLQCIIFSCKVTFLVQKLLTIYAYMHIFEVCDPFFYVNIDQLVDQIDLGTLAINIYVRPNLV